MKQYETLGVKLDTSVAASFQTWCKTNGMNTAEALTYMIQCALQSTNAISIVNEKLRDVLQTFDLYGDIDKVKNVISPSSKLDVLECVYILTREDSKAKYPLLVERSMMDDVNYSESTEEIMDEMFGVCYRGLRKRLRRLAKTLGTNGIEETITALCAYFENNEDVLYNEIMEMFSDNNRHDYGSSTELVKYVRHNKMSVNNSMQLTLFEDLEKHEKEIDNEQGQELQEDNTEREVAEPEPEDEADG